MKALHRKSAILAVIAVFSCTLGGLCAQEKERYYFGIKGGYSLLEDPSVNQLAYPGRYPNRPVLGVFLTRVDYPVEGPWWSRVREYLEIGYLDQSSIYDVVLRDDQGNILMTYPEKCSRKYLQTLSLVKCPLKSGRRMTPVLLAGTAMTVLLKTSRDPGTGDPVQAAFKGAVFSFVIGTGLEFRVGKQLLSLDVRYDWGFDSFGLGRDDPKPDSLMVLAGIGF
jgi:hypothetical protein